MKITEEMLHEAYIKHLAWLDGYAADWKGWQMRFSRYDISYNFKNRNLRKASFERCNIADSGFINCDMTGIMLNSATLSNCTLKGNSLVGAKLYCTDMTDVLIKFCDFAGTDFKYSTFRNVNMQNNNLSNADFSFSSFDDECDVRFSNIIGANFTNTRFDFGKKEGLPDFCYYNDSTGNTILISLIDKKVYSVPENMKFLPADRLNAALNISDDIAKQMYQEYITGFGNRAKTCSKYKANIIVTTKEGEKVYKYSTDEYTDKDKFDKYVAELCNNEKKRNSKLIVKVEMMKKAASDKEYSVYNNI